MVHVVLPTKNSLGESQVPTDLLLKFLNFKIQQLLQVAHKLEKIDENTERITKPLSIYSNGVIFESLGDGGFRVNDSERTISLNLEIVQQFIRLIKKKEELRIALLIFLLHEVSHISQGIVHHADVQRLKRVGVDIGRERMGELDLRSDYWTAYVLSMFFTVKQRGTYNIKKQISWLHKIWCEVCRSMLNAFPPGTRQDKQQRVFGYLLMANLIREAYTKNYPLEFNAELWPQWSASLDSLTIYSNGYPFIPGSSIDPILMKQILDDITQGSYDCASSGIGKLWYQMPRR